MKKQSAIETLAIHAGRTIDPATGAVTPPIHLSTTFERDPGGGHSRGYDYARADNPNRKALEHCVTALEGGAAAAAFASGSAASLAVFANVESARHIITSPDLYHGTTRQLREVAPRLGKEVSFVDTTDLDAVRESFRPDTALVWLETPSNPMLKISDIAAIAELAHSNGALLACDNTLATPIGQSPLELGADIVVHSATKYLGGHSDILGGAVIAAHDDELFERIRGYQSMSGAGLPPFDSWLFLRSIATLPYRFRGHCSNAERTARFLSEHSTVESVLYPGLDAHPGHDLAKRQMKAYGGIVSFCVPGGAKEALAIAARAQLFTRATSLGGVESLIEHRASIEGPETRTPENLLRLSVGLEHPDDLIADLEQMLRGR